MNYHVIKYANRKLYLKEESRYIRLEELVNLLTVGKNTVSIIDSKTKEDVSAQSIASAISSQVASMGSLEKANARHKLESLLKSLRKGVVKEGSV